MTLRGLHEALACWRPARPSDLPEIERLAALVHPDHPERPAVFAERLALHPSGMLRATLDGAPVGYAIGHPWHGPPPLLDRLLGTLPERPDGFWLHDVALLPPARSLGLGRAALLLLRADAMRCGARHLRLVSVGGARRFWEAAGFTATGETPPACYGGGATVMRQAIG